MSTATELENILRRIVREEMQTPLTPEAIRICAQLSQTQLSQLSDVSISTIQRFENGTCVHPQEDTLWKVATHLPNPQAYIVAVLNHLRRERRVSA